MRFGIREIVFLLILLAVPVASWLFVFKPQNHDINQATSEIEQKRQKLEQLREVTRHIDDLGLAIEEGRQAIAEIEAKLPSAQGIDGILQNTWEIADRNRLVVKSVKTEKSIPAAEYMERPLKIIMEGEFDGFYEFLLELEQLPRITRIHDLKLERKSGSTNMKQRNAASENAMRAEFTLSIYYESDRDG
ncbi:MAG: type 4a pilus biogenesis protein PilO [Phycisphaerales bacterium]|nr:type 4a pilus biogenesis protein PilO [Phycisphaerales bacterium]